MPYITSFSIEGLAGREEPCSHELNKDTNIFFGTNGCGKTSVLRILHSALSNDTSLIKNVVFKKATVQFYSIYYAKTFTRVITKTKNDETIKFSSEQKSQDYRKDTDWHWEIDPVPHDADGFFDRSGGFRSTYLPTTRLYTEILGPYHENQLSEDSLDEHFSQALNNLWSYYSKKILSTVGAVQDTGLESILESVLSPTMGDDASKSLEIDHAYNSAMAFLQRRGSANIIGSRIDFEERYRNDVQMRRIVNNINSIEEQIITVQKPIADLKEAIDLLFRGSKEVNFTNDTIELSASGKPLNLSGLSSGEKHVLRILLDNLTTDTVMLIDEPEISLHIDWQMRLVSIIKKLNPQSQLIIATHSPEIMAEASDDKIFRL